MAVDRATVSEVEILGYLRERGYRWRLDGRRALVDRCPVCEEEGCFAVRTDVGTWRCGRCGQAGTLMTLRRILGEIDPISLLAGQDQQSIAIQEVEDAHARLMAERAVVAWLESNLVGEETAGRLRLGLYVHRKTRCLGLPYLEDGGRRCTNLCLHPLPGQQGGMWRAYRSSNLGVYNAESWVHMVGKEGVEITVLLDELDVAVGVSAGLRVCGVAGGEHGNREFGAVVYDWLDRWDRINIVTAAGRTGEEFAGYCAGRLGGDRIRHVQLPRGAETLADMLRAGATASDVLRLVDEAEPMHRRVMVRVSEALEDYIRELNAPPTTPKVEFPWPRLNEATGKLEGGDLVIVVGMPKVGKTTWALNAMLHISQALHHPTLLYSLEMRTQHLVRMAAQTYLRRPEQEFTAEDQIFLRGRMHEWPLYLCEALPSGRDRVGSVVDMIRMAKQRFGVVAVAFDNLHSLVRGGDDESSKVGETSLRMKDLARELDIVIFLLAHTGKMDPTLVPGMYAPRGSSGTIGDCDVEIALWRRPILEGQTVTMEDTADGDLEPWMIARVLKTRHAEGGQAILYFDGQRSFIGSKGDLEDTGDGGEQ